MRIGVSARMTDEAAALAVRRAASRSRRGACGRESSLVVAAAVVVVLTSGCSSQSKLSADQYYSEASTAFEGKNYDVAINRYKELLDQYPFSDHAEEAELRIAHAQYKSKHYPEAIAAFNDFQRMHPLSPHLPQVYYLLGKSYMDQMTTIDRDQGASENAHGWFRVVMDRYPDSPYAAKARRQLAKCRDALAGHELYIAAYYFKRGNLSAGENRVKGILENYPDTDIATRALEQLAAAYGAAHDAEREQLARAALTERSRRDRPVAVAPEPAAADDSNEGADDAPPTAADPPAADPPAADARSSAGGGLAPAADADQGGPQLQALLAHLSSRYGPGQGVSAATTAPSLLDPAPATKSTLGDPRHGPVPGSEPSGY